MKLFKQQLKMKGNDTFRIITIGTGAPPLNTQRASACTLVQYKDVFFPVDLGYGSVGNMFSMGIKPADIKHAFITHMHSDHTIDYGIFLMGGWHEGRRGLVTVGPKGIVEMHDHYVGMYSEDISYRMGLGNPAAGLTENMEFRVVEGGESFEYEGVKISCLHVPHTAYTVAYKFEADGKKVVVSADLTYSDDFVEFAKDADVLVLDANMAPSDAPNHSDPVFLERILKSHATIEQIAEMAQKSCAKSIILTHMTPKVYPGEMVNAVAQIYKGEIHIAEDCLALDLD
jgi:ribonuclease BN (tRNA processing enzyme)